MSDHVPFVQQLAGISATLRADAAARACESGVIAALQALLLAALLRLVDRLQELVTLWAAGQLPPPRPRAPRRALPYTRTTDCRTRAPRASARAHVKESVVFFEKKKKTFIREDAPISGSAHTKRMKSFCFFFFRKRRFFLFDACRHSPTHAHFVTI